MNYEEYLIIGLEDGWIKYTKELWNEYLRIKNGNNTNKN